ncbi:PqqD family protein [Candidatus Micrarchaeota archaeon]|nr:PqqD family protein [Candidatus Micrarchaeota archaeon]
MPYSKNPQIIDKETDSGLLLFNTDSGRMMELNSTARLLWQKTGESFELADLREIIEKNCSEANGIDADIEEFITAAIKHGLVTDNGKN